MLGNNKTNCPKKTKNRRMSVYVFKPDQHSFQSSLGDLKPALAQDLTEGQTFSFINPFRHHVRCCQFAKHGRQSRCSPNTYG